MQRPVILIYDPALRHMKMRLGCIFHLWARLMNRGVIMEMKTETVPQKSDVVGRSFAAESARPAAATLVTAT